MYFMTLMIPSFWAKKKKKKVLERARSEENPLMINQGPESIMTNQY